MTRCLDHPFGLIDLAETNSTNVYLRQLCDRREASEFTVVVAGFQTAGKGQRGNSWEAERGKNLLFSLLLKPDFLPACQQFLLSQIVSVSIWEALEARCGDISIKWPNDIYWRDKKICGILIEHDMQGANLAQTVIGIGLNVNQEVFRSDAPNPVSLKQITGGELDCYELLRDLLRRMLAYYEALRRGDTSAVVRRYDEALYRKGRLARYSDAGGVFRGRILRVEPNGLLVIGDEEGRERTYAFKEVSYEDVFPARSV